MPRRSIYPIIQTRAGAARARSLVLDGPLEFYGRADGILHHLSEDSFPRVARRTTLSALGRDNSLHAYLLCYFLGVIENHGMASAGRQLIRASALQSLTLMRARARAMRRLLSISRLDSVICARFLFLIRIEHTSDGTIKQPISDITMHRKTMAATF